MSEVSQDDIPVLAKMLGDDGLASLKQAAQSEDETIRHTAKMALMDYEIIKGDAEQSQ